MKKLMIYRHAKKDATRKENLSAEGIAAAEQLGARLQYQTFSRIFLGTFFRLAETAAAVVRGGNLAVREFTQIDMIGAPWDWCERAFKAAGAQSVEAFEAADPDFVKVAGQGIAGSYRQAFSLLKDDEIGLAFGHSPLTEMAVEALTGYRIATPLKELEGVQITLHDDRTYQVTELRVRVETHAPAPLGY